MTVNWWTIALQAINFLVLVWLLQRLLFKPVQNVIARRKALVEEAFEEAAAAKEAAETEQKQYAAGQAALDESRQDMLTKAHQEIEADRDRVLEDARAEADDLIRNAREQIESERRAAITDTRSQVADLAVQMAGQLLRQVAEPPGGARRLNDAFLEQVLARLDALEPEALRSLRAELEDGTEGLRVVTGIALNAEEQGRWQRALQDRIGPPRRMEFLVEPDLIGGAELRFPHAVLSLAWSEQLRQGRDALLANEKHH
jgi:F-type H+-transporting ATPase subunit b